MRLLDFCFLGLLDLCRSISESPDNSRGTQWTQSSSTWHCVLSMNALPKLFWKNIWRLAQWYTWVLSRLLIKRIILRRLIQLDIDHIYHSNLFIPCHFRMTEKNDRCKHGLWFVKLNWLVWSNVVHCFNFVKEMMYPCYVKFSNCHISILQKVSWIQD